ncbi:MAG: hypothetical protein ACRDA0_03890 [Cetobacterium sp.]|uniref:hypothetical protein n=2 Tax=Cetobacterium sp. TaxID=2071632 RepID=UPI003F348C1C
MKKCLSNSWNIRLLLLAFIAATANAQVVEPPNAYDEYEVIESFTTQSLEVKEWTDSVENVRGVEFQNLELGSNLQEADRLPETENMIYKGRAFLENRRGVIYSIVDPVAVDPKLNILTNSYALVDSVGKLKAPITFYAYSNYEKSIKSYEVRIYKENDYLKRDPAAILKGDKVDFNSPITWDGTLEKEDDLENTKKIYYVFRVYGNEGTFDETDLKTINLNDIEMKEFNEDNKSIKDKVYGTSNLAIQNIPVTGSKVRFYGRDIDPKSIVKIDDQNIELDPTGDFIYETISDSPLKVYNFKIENGGKNYSYPIEVETPKDYEYLVALADFTFGDNKVTGSDSIFTNDVAFKPSYYNTGRLAFYYKGVKNKYKITAQADTWEDEIKNMFKDFHKRDNNAIFRKLDRQYLPFDYGDESERYYDVESEGKAYLRVDWDKSQVLWGNYETGLDAGFFNNYNRSLYGARVEHNSLETNPFGESKQHIEIFAANPDTSYKRDAFLGTGGSIYTLSERDIVVGSAKLTLEIRDKKTGRILDRANLTEGSDYTINELSGRVILSNPLNQTYFTEKFSDIVKSSPSGERTVYLMADYEFYSAADNISNLTAGGRGKTWITDNIGLGGTYVKENRKGSTIDYELKSADITLKKSEGTYIKAEYSETEGNQLTKNSNWFSYNGGYDFIQQPIIKANGKGRAYYVEGSLSPNDYSEKFNPDDNILAWYSRKDKNFSTASEASGIEKEELGIKAEHRVDDKTTVFGEVAKYKESEYDDLGAAEGFQEQKTVSVGVSREVTEKLDIGFEAEYVKNSEDESELITYNSEDLDNGEAVLLATRIGYKFNEELDGYLKLQSSVWRDKGYRPNNLATVGAQYTPTEKLELGGAVSSGNRGSAAEVTVGYKYSPDYEIYAGYTFENEDDATRDITFGQRFLYSEKVTLFQENSIMKNYSEKGLLQGYGVDYEYQKNLFLGFMYERGDVDILDGKVKRNNFSTSLRYEDEEFYSKHRLEYGKDTGARSSSTFASINSAKWKPTPEYTVFGEANYVTVNGDSYTYKRDESEYISRTFDSHDKFYELGLGFGYRPVYNDRLNLISRWNYIYDTAGSGIVGSPTDFKFEAHLFSIEAIYDLSQRWTVAGKYAIREDRVKLLSGGDWFSNTLNMYSFRATYEIIYKWDIFAEYSLLESRKTDEVKHGAQVGVYRDINENMQVGVGYNFSKFDDNLKDLRYKNGGKDLDYETQGWFINIIGKF